MNIFAKKLKEMNKIKKIRIATFEINRYGGIIAYVENVAKTLIEMGYDVDILVLSYSKSDSVGSYNRKLKDLETGKFQAKAGAEVKSQNGGYSKSPITGYFYNTYYGWHLPPVTNRISVFSEDALDNWKKATEDVDLILWNFMPTKQQETRGLDFWYKFYDLPKKIKQVFLVHDAYFDVRNAWVTALKDKISFLACAHIAAYNCCENIGIPRELIFNPRYMPNKLVNYVKKDEREIDFFAAHIFKSMKRMDDLLRMTPYLGGKHSVWMAGSGIELYYMMAKEKIKDVYRCRKKDDPDLPSEWEGKPLWERAEENGLEYLGLISNEIVYDIQKNCKFSIDPSYCKHYAHYSNTHINGFTIEAMLNGSYPVLRDYRGLVKEEVVDPLFDSIEAIKIPWDATPKQFAGFLREASKMKESKYREGIDNNFSLVTDIFDTKKNMKALIDLAEDGFSNLSTGKDSPEVIKQSKDIMENYFGINLPIKWNTI